MNRCISGGRSWGQLSDWEVFSKVRAQEDFGCLVWTDELDYCPDSAFKDSKPLPLGILEDLMEVYSTKKADDSYFGDSHA